MWTLQRLADFLAEETEVIVSFQTVRRLLAQAEIVFSQPQHKVSSPDPDYTAKKQLVEET